ncbi:TetR/AcrR family transcriptional regulator [Mycolicibacterium porcinum]|uniref:TetR/AcrR family transcriptional regulator n=1 Tax=Mycolicibacterium porcinum TaxID=39693 RepID=A0AAW5T3F9_9MYCO|nr:TetR/AcrR family transcriptional regulator [Mycolicibacterium porcinum]MCV7388710.1 TetR/AcrR family transcriptional regulator [Mycolicibacterium porcinum]ORB34821.1 TetR family transcriptional regulator [Mycolicibacterium porcinum]CDO30955.1 TetR family transcriptional regulator [Mycolicibacterium vulneris]
MTRKPANAANGAAPESDTKAARTRARILDAAAHVLSIKGYAGTRLTDVAEFAEIQAPAIYYYFSSREELIEEVMFSGIGEMRRHLKSTLDDLPPDISPMDKILAAVEAHLRHELELSDYTTASIRNSGQIPEHLRTRQRKEEAAYGRVWRRLLDDALEAKQLNPELDTRTAQLLVLGALNWAAEWFDSRKFTVDSVVRNAQILVRNGLQIDDTA